MKKYVALLLCALFLLQPVLCTPAHAAGTPTIVCEDVTCEPGEQITVAVTIENNPGFMYLEMTPTYSSELSLVKAANGDIISDFTNGKQYVWLSDEDATEDGLLMTFTFDVAETVPAGEYSVGFVFRECVNYDEESVNFRVESGTVIVGSTGVVEHTYVENGKEKTVSYKTLEEALAVANSGTVKLLADAETSVVSLNSNVTLDLNGYVLTASAVAAKIQDSADGRGLLNTEEDAVITASEDQLPLWDKNGELSGYRFFDYTFVSAGITPDENSADSLAQSFWSVLKFTNADAYQLVQYGVSGLTVGFEMDWNSVKKTFEYDSTVVMDWGKSQYANSDKTYGLYIRITGFEKLTESGTLTAAPYIAVANKTVKSDVMIYEYTIAE